MNENKIGKFIAEERKKKNMTQKDLADKLYVTDRAVSKWERGLSYPDILLLEKICEILEVNVSELLNGKRIETINKEKADNIVKDSIAIYQSREKKKIYSNLKKVIVALLIILFFYCFLSSQIMGRIYLAPKTYIEWETKECRDSRKTANRFMKAIENKDIKTINKLMNKYLTTPEPPYTEEDVKDNIQKYENYLEEFYQNFNVISAKHYSYSYSSGKSIYTHEYNVYLEHLATKTRVFCYIQIKSDKNNVYLNAVGYEDDDHSSMNFINNNKDIWESVNNVFSHSHSIKNLKVKLIPEKK